MPCAAHGRRRNLSFSPDLSDAGLQERSRIRSVIGPVHRVGPMASSGRSGGLDAGSQLAPAPRPARSDREGHIAAFARGEHVLVCLMR
jgi:hypothetical protein